LFSGEILIYDIFDVIWKSDTIQRPTESAFCGENTSCSRCIVQ